MQFVDKEDSYRSELYDYFEEGNHYTEECFNYFNNEEDNEEVDFYDYCEESEKPNLCEYCENEGHGVWECYEFDENHTVSIPENKFCEVYNGVGHLWKECPKSQNSVSWEKESPEGKKKGKETSL
ncbi:656_t:CDS:2 [Funneliformis mosseae]|uniref:656_t:CDS:1 n=1 Tax=Funneliformis mosseae TaxID=27381 RepID=A0A9N8WKS0_FUNMO|nr:656_t:CDS:2 [Funneliformis mosseae]